MHPHTKITERLRRALAAAALALAMTPPLAADNPPPLSHGETLSYRISWGPFDKAAQIEITATGETRGGRALTRITTTGKTTGAIGALYSFKGVATALFENDTGRLLSINNEFSTGKKRSQTNLVADHEKNKALYTETGKPNPKTITFSPDEPLVDFISALILARARPLQPGDSRDLSVIFDDDLYTLTLSAYPKQIIMTPGGPRETILIQPAQRGKARGIFRRGGRIRVWVSDDAIRIPLRLEIKLKYGTAIGTLISSNLTSPPEK